MKNETPLNWYAKTINAGSPHEQGLVIDEATGRNVAVAYDSKDAALIAAAPRLLAALSGLLARAAALDQSATVDGLANCDAMRAARAAISEAIPPQNLLQAAALYNGANARCIKVRESIAKTTGKS